MAETGLFTAELSNTFSNCVYHIAVLPLYQNLNTHVLAFGDEIFLSNNNVVGQYCIILMKSYTFQLRKRMLKLYVATQLQFDISTIFMLEFQQCY